MPTTIRIHVFHGDQTELLPTMCMFCAQPLTEDEFQRVAVQLADELTRPVLLPICSRHPRSGGLHADGNPVPITVAKGMDIGPVGAVIAHHVRLHQESAGTTVTIPHVHDAFAAELERLRHLTPAEYDALMAEANKAFIAKIAGGSVEKLLTAEELAEFEQRAVEDVSAFGMEGAVRKADLSVEFSRRNSRKMMILWLIVGAIAVVLVTSIAVGVGAYLVFGQKPQVAKGEADQKKQPLPLKEIRAKIKNIDRDQRTIRLLVGDGKYQLFRITPETEFRDFGGQRLPQGLDAPELRVEEFALIMPTEDRQGLQYLKLTR